MSDINNKNVYFLRELEKREKGKKICKELITINSLEKRLRAKGKKNVLFEAKREKLKKQLEELRR